MRLKTFEGKACRSKRVSNHLKKKNCKVRTESLKNGEKIDQQEKLSFLVKKKCKAIVRMDKSQALRLDKGY